MQFAPVCRLSDGALAAVELQLRGPAGTRLATAAALNNGSTWTWVCGAVVLVAGAVECFLIARVRIPDVQHLRALGFDTGRTNPEGQRR